MSDPLAVLQTPAEEPLAPVTPVEPITPVEPVVPAAPVDELTPEEKADAEEWDAATKDIFPDLDKKEEKKDESAKSEEELKKVKEEEAGKEGDEPLKPEDKVEPKVDTTDKTEDEPTEPSDATARLTLREQQAEIDSVKSDVRDKMFADVPTQLKDADGDIIKSVEDVVKLINPNTGERFTVNEAGQWLLLAQNSLKDTVANIDAQVNQIADTNLNIKDQADLVNYQYGELLQSMPDLRAKLWGEYEKTLQKDPKSGIITKAPVSLQSFYEAALEPLAELGRQLESQNSAKVQADTTAAEALKAAEAAKIAQTRADRSDIYGKGKVDVATEDDKEWSAAAEAVFGPRN